jgi:8-oxo-dGTP pyrophosphatase MutT (NUDIX family)
MQDRTSYGDIDQSAIGRKNDYLFRLSIKALIQNDDGEILVVKETGRDWWDLPGGGMDHEESIKDAIARELKEEVNLSGDFTYKVISVDEPAFLDHANLWQVRLVFLVKPDVMQFSPGEDGDDLTFIKPNALRDSANGAERMVYQYSKLV